ncbi:hypothetical protein ACIA8E_41020, partial [Streptomyces sp. NPDC051664]|uniref:hypothetical protein n=1 Tax=Streptomyces sp. NPDC051664 TaxID=3365668 RepID=UPI0037AF2707
STAHALTDPPTTHQYGFGSGEIEDAHPLEFPEPVYPGELLATHPSGTKIVVDTSTFWQAGTTLYPSAQKATEAQPRIQPERVSVAIPEIVLPLIRILPEETDRSDAVTISDAMRLLETTRQAFNATDQNSRRLPFAQVLARHGWKFTELGLSATIFPAPTGPDHPAYSQYTFGVPVSGLMEFLDTTQGRLAKQAAVPLFIWSRSFGQKVAAHYAAEILRTTVNPGDVPFLQDLEGVSQVAGYAWLFANHAAAFPMTYLGALNPRTGEARKMLTKNWLPVANRNYFHQLLREVNPQVRAFFERRFAYISETFAAQFIDFIRFQGYQQSKFNSNSDVLGIPLAGSNDATLNIRDYLRYVMTGSRQDGGTVSPERHGMKRDYVDMDRVDRSTPLALLEVRYSSGASSGSRIHPHEFKAQFSEYAAAVNLANFIDKGPRISPSIAQGILHNEKVQKFSLAIEAIQEILHFGSPEDGFLRNFRFSVITSVGGAIARGHDLYPQVRAEFESLLADLRTLRDRSDMSPNDRRQFGSVVTSMETALQSLTPRR